MRAKASKSSKMAVPNSTEQLVALAQGGDTQAFEELVRRYRERIFALAFHLTGSKGDADDVTQDAFVRAYEKLAEFEGRSAFFTWLYRIAVNRALNVRRSQARRRTTTLDDPRVEAAVAVDAGGDPRRATELRQSYARLIVALDAMEKPMRATVVLVALQGMSHDEAAAVLGCPSGTVAWRIHEARKILKNAVDPPSALSVIYNPRPALV